MFKIAVSSSYFAPVTVELPGSKVKHVFSCEFKRLSAEDLKILQYKANSGELDDAGYVREILVGWKDVSDEDGEMEFTPDNLDRLLAIYPVPQAIIEGFFSSLAGSRLKN